MAYVVQDFDGGGLMNASLNFVSLSAVLSMVSTSTSTRDGDGPLAKRRTYALATAASGWIKGTGSARKATVAMNETLPNSSKIIATILYGARLLPRARPPLLTTLTTPLTN
jgi:hypothetical protein